MSIEHPSVPIETLLTHRAWVRRLARSLVRDDASVDDLEQRTWLTALRRPPRHVASARAWLGRVVRNLAWNAHRARGRRLVHEFAARRRGCEPSAAVGLGLLAGYLGGTLSSPTAAPPPDAEVAELRRQVEFLAAADRGATDSARERAALAERRDAQERRIWALEESLALVHERTEELALNAFGTLSHEEIAKDRSRLEEMGTLLLLREVQRLTRQAQRTRTRFDGEKALRACSVALARQLETEQRASTLLCRGNAYRAIGDVPNAEAAFRETIQVEDLSTRNGRHAANNLAYTLGQKGDWEETITWWLAVANRPDAPDDTSAWYRYLAASCLAQAGQTDRARKEYRTVIAEYGDEKDESLVKTVRNCRKALERLDAIDARK